MPVLSLISESDTPHLSDFFRGNPLFWKVDFMMFSRVVSGGGAFSVLVLMLSPAFSPYQLIIVR